MKSRFIKLTIIGMIFALNLPGLSVQATGVEASQAVSKDCLSPSKVKLQGELRKLWMDHVYWTRSYIVSAVAGLEDQDKVLSRLLQNQQDIGNAIKPYYGEEAGNKLAALLREHILIAGKLVGALKAGNQADADKFNNEWYRNADDMAAFLSSANPNWTNKELKDLLHMHLQLLAEDVTARLHKDWDGDIAAFDKGENHIIVLADVLTKGIIKQFPNQFK